MISKRKIVVAIVVIVVFGFSVLSLWLYGHVTSSININMEAIEDIQPWWQNYKGNIFIQTPLTKYPWYLTLGNPDGSSVNIKQLSFEKDGIQKGNSLFYKKDDKSIYVMNPYVFFVPYEEPYQTNIPNTSRINIKMQQWLKALYSSGQFTIYLQGLDDNDLFAFLTILYDGITNRTVPSLPSIFIEAQEKKDVTTLGFSKDTEYIFDINGTFFTDGPGKLLLETLISLQQEGFLPYNWQYFTQEDIDNQMSLAKEPIVLFGPYSYKKNIYATKLLTWKVKQIDTTLIPAHLLQVSIPKKNVRKADAELFNFLILKESLKILNEKTPYLTISFDIPLLNKDHRTFIEELNKGIAMPCNFNKQDALLIHHWLENFRDLIRKTFK